MIETTPLLATFALIFLAEMGDKSQLVCMTLAARHSRLLVLLGATLAFSILNLLAVLFGAAVAAWLPDRLVAAIVALLFAAFGLHALLSNGGQGDGAELEKSGYSVFVTTTLLIFAAEFGDKTQLAVAGLASSTNPVAVWLGATAALLLVSAVGVWAGSVLLRRFSRTWLHRISGGVFMVFALIAALRAIGVA
jgi:putative Ca2+/H+ antiporter (TMEM165/GDT1 family)